MINYVTPAEKLVFIINTLSIQRRIVIEITTPPSTAKLLITTRKWVAIGRPNIRTRTHEINLESQKKLCDTCSGTAQQRTWVSVKRPIIIKKSQLQSLTCVSLSCILVSTVRYLLVAFDLLAPGVLHRALC